MQSHFQHHVFICLNRRDNNEPCCMQHDAENAFEYMKAKVKSLGLAGEGKVRINRAGCLDHCNNGPVMVVYPQAVWYTFIDNEDIDEIIEIHLIKGQIVERLTV